MTMQFSVTGKQMDIGDALRSHIEQHVTAVVGKYFGDGIEAHAVMCRETYLYCCDLSVHVGRGILIQASEKAADPYQASDMSLDHVAKQLRRYKRKLRDRHQNAHVSPEREEVLYAQLSDPAGADKP